MAALLRIEWKDPDAARIAKELRMRRGMLFTFLRTPEAPYHNNAAENAIRQGVLSRTLHTLFRYLAVGSLPEAPRRARAGPC